MTGFTVWVFLVAQGDRLLVKPTLADNKRVWPSRQANANVIEDGIRHVSNKDPLEVEDVLPPIVRSNSANSSTINLCRIGTPSSVR